ncbi:glycogen debranching N-terminal domain-containing protein [Plantactinospora sp. GCM10030261]|uniref:amylo-alpha-1,6-glucosidase n=1 Tax=Plantactinospora sp. GCM10030261 TaxID=3273420 RepID=UPI00360F1309
MDPNTVNLIDGNLWVLSDRTGDIRAAENSSMGMYSFDMRHLSQWELTLNGERLHPLSVDDLSHFEARFFLVPGAATHYVDAAVSVIRHRWVGASFDEELAVLNHANEPASFRIRIDMSSDFADTVWLRLGEHGPRVGHTYAAVQDGHLRLTYERETFVRETIVSSSEPATVDERGMTFDVTVPPHSGWRTGLHVEAVLRGARGRDVRASLAAHKGRERVQIRQELDDWIDEGPRLNSDSSSLRDTYRQSMIDLCTLRYSPLSSPLRLPMAGMPWYMTLFGRDALFTCLQTVPLLPSLSQATLVSLATAHGTVRNDFRGEEPGKVIYEIRYGESGAFEEVPNGFFFGAADTTPLFVVLLDEYERWSGDDDLVRKLEHETRSALAWIDRYADLTGRGYLAFDRRDERTGVVNQCWKTSRDSISWRDGRLPGYPLATCELQGYAYEAKLRGARLARQFWGDPAYADRLEREAAELKERFNRDFWIADRGYYAVALAPDGTPVDALTSNIGHLLWNRIADEDKAERVAEHLLSDRLFSGWGVRTLATDSRRYNPVGMHTGSIWPFDNAIAACGLRRYGMMEPAARISGGIIEAADYFKGRLPAAFAGYDRAVTRYPVTRPGVAAPRGMSAAAPLMLIQVMLGMEVVEGHLSVEPSVPESMGCIELLGIPGRWGRLDAFARGRLPVPA